MKFVIGVIIGIIVIVFMVQNVEKVDIQFFAWSVTVSRAIMILIVLAVGIVLGWVIKSLGYRKKRKKAVEESERNGIKTEEKE